MLAIASPSDRQIPGSFRLGVGLVAAYLVLLGAVGLLSLTHDPSFQDAFVGVTCLPAGALLVWIAASWLRK
ncbi:MAG TPA: hypothetical protein VF746_18770 [Longimicrobium sp.]|jgi:hypothetical protein